MENLEPLAEQFFELFAGNDAGHGEFRITNTEGVKAKGKAKTIQKPVTVDMWKNHLLGKTGIGVVPIRGNSTCVWGCVDIDEYEDIDLEDMSFKLPKPLVLCRSKSGGAHVFMFTNSPVSAKLLRKKLTLVARALGQPNAEVFPKQDEMSDGDIGNWLNMPYFDADSTMRYCIKGGVALTAEEFVGYVLDSAVGEEQLVSLSFDPILDEELDDEFKDAPPCIKYLVQHGVPPGQRNSALFSFGVFARKKFPNIWEDKVMEYNLRFMGPGTYTEVAGIIRSLSKKSYTYKCKDQPLVHLCSRQECSEMEYGLPLLQKDEKQKRPCILDEVETPVKCYQPEDLNSQDEPYWIFKIQGRDLFVSLDMLSSQGKFGRGFLKQFHRVILPVTEKRWQDTVNPILETAEIFELAPDAGPEGQLRIHVEDFCTGKSKARSRDELILGKPWEEENRIYFRGADLMKYLDQQRYRAFKEHEIWSILKRTGAEHHKFHIKGKHVSCWSLPSYAEQNEPFEQEDMQDDSTF